MTLLYKLLLLLFLCLAGLSACFTYYTTDLCRSFENVAKDTALSKQIATKLSAYLNDPLARNELESHHGTVTDLLFFDNQPAIDWQALGIQPNMAQIVIKRDWEGRKPKKIYTLTEAGIGARRSYLMFKRDINNSTTENIQFDPHPYVDCKVHDGG